MKTRVLLIAVLFAVCAFQKPVQSTEKPGIVKKLVWLNYCGFLSAGCPGGSVEIKIASDLTTAYVLAVTVGGTAIPFSVVSIVPTPGSPGVFTVNINYQCGGTWRNYQGGAYTSTC
jgi:hypothetical protein